MRLGVYAVLRLGLALGVMCLSFVSAQTTRAACLRGFQPSPSRSYHVSLEQILEDREKGVHSFRQKQLQRRRLKVNDGLICIGDSNRPLSTDSLLKALSLGGRPWFHTSRWGYVLTTDGEIFVSPPSATVNHGSFADKVLAAGELVIFDGELKYIDNKSGHFKAQSDSIPLVLHRLFALGVSADRIKSVMISVR